MAAGLLTETPSGSIIMTAMYTLAQTAAEDQETCLDLGCLQHVLGHQLALADVPTRKTFFKHIGKPLDLRPAEFSMLLLIAHNLNVTQKQLSQALAMPAPNVTTMLDRMTQRGLLTREPNATDRRSVHIVLTESGQELAQQSRDISLKMERHLLRHLSDAERAMLRELLHKVAQQAISQSNTPT